MAHELSHIVLRSLWHKERNNEVYADLTAMILGFSRVMKKGRKIKETQPVGTRNHVIYSETVTKTLMTTYGYLSDDQFKLASDKIDGILKKYRTSCRDSKEKLMRRLTDYEKQILIYGRQLFKFGKFIDYRRSLGAGGQPMLESAGPDANFDSLKDNIYNGKRK